MGDSKYDKDGELYILAEKMFFRKEIYNSARVVAVLGCSVNGALKMLGHYLNEIARMNAFEDELKSKEGFPHMRFETLIEYCDE